MMKCLFLLFLFLGLATTVPAQSSWLITHNGQQKIKTATEDAEKNTFSLKRSDLKRSGYLWVAYTDKETEKGWKRVIALIDDKDGELLKHGGKLLKVGNPKLNALANKVKTIHIYTWAIPADPAVAATVRVRRIHLGTITITGS